MSEPPWAPFEAYAGEYDRWFETHPGLYNEEIQLLRRMLPPWTSAVEIGVGTGRSAVPLGIPLGLEPAFAMGRLAKERGVEVVRGLAGALPFCSARFDLVLMVTVIFLLPDVGTAFGEAARVLEPGGSLVVAFIDREGDLGRKYAAERARSRFMRDARFLSREDVRTLLERAGMRVRAVDALANGYVVCVAQK